MAKPIEQMSLEEAEAELANLESQKPKPIEQMSLEEAEAELARVEAEKVSPAGAALVGTAQGLTFGFSDEIKAAARAGAGAVKGEGSFADLFEKFKTEERDLVRRAREQQPVTTGVSQVGGAIATSGPLGLAKAGLGRAALAGGVAAAGESEAEVGTKEFVEETAKGALAGATFEAGFRGIGRVLKSVSPSAMKATAESRAVKAFKPVQSVQQAMEKKGTVHEIGRQILDDKILSVSPRKTLEKALANLDDAGKKVGKAVERIDDIMVEAKDLVKKDKLLNFVPDEKVGFLIAQDGTIITKKAVLNKMDEVFNEPYIRIGQRLRGLADEIREDPQLRNQVKRLEDLAEGYGGISPAMRPMDRLRRFKTNAGKLSNFDSETVPQKFRQKVYGILREEMENAAGRVENIEDAVLAGKISLDDIINFNAVQSARTPDELLAANRLFGRRVEVKDLAERVAARAASNKDFSLSDTIAGATGVGVAATTGDLRALALPIVNNIVRKYGNPAMAIGLDKLAKAGGRITNTAAARALTEAAQKGPNSLIATHIMLMNTDKEYKDTLNKQGLARSLPLQRTPLLGGR